MARRARPRITPTTMPAIAPDERGVAPVSTGTAVEVEVDVEMALLLADVLDLSLLVVDELAVLLASTNNPGVSG